MKHGLSEALHEGTDGKRLRTRSVINLSSVCVKALDAISLWSSLPQFLDSDSASVSEYNCTFGFRWARRLRTAAMTFRALAKVSMIGDQGQQRDRPLLALILHFIAQVEDDLPVLTSQSLICRFHFFE